MSESLNPPDRKTIVGTSGGTVLLSAWIVAGGGIELSIEIVRS
jgi:hypothetical protein